MDGARAFGAPLLDLTLADLTTADGVSHRAEHSSEMRGTTSGFAATDSMVIDVRCFDVLR